MDAHEALVERLAFEIDPCLPRDAFDGRGYTSGSRIALAVEKARAALSVVAEALSKPTEEMVAAWERDASDWIAERIEAVDHPWRVMLSVSPLYPKKDGGNG